MADEHTGDTVPETASAKGARDTSSLTMPGADGAGAARRSLDGVAPEIAASEGRGLADEERDPSLSRFFGIRSWLQDTLETLLLAIILFLVINTLTGRYQVHGHSMVPSLQDGQYLIASKVTYWLHPPQRGDVVVLEPPGGSGEVPYIKRVIGLPGDVVEVRDRRVWVNGIALNEPYISAPPAYSGNWIVDESTYFVLGDNRNNSSDSHNWGLLDRQHILGKAFFSYWPPEHWGVIPHYVFPELEAAPQ